VGAKADPVKQKLFRDNVLEPLIERAKNGLIELFFMDASHFVMGGFASRVWWFARVFVKTASGRKRFNVLGALNFVTHKVEAIYNDTYITSAQIVEMLENLAKEYTKPIYAVLDNASYQTCTLVLETAERLGIQLIFLTTYSPNLNLIERVWKLVKSRVLHFAYFDTFADFSNKIRLFVTDLHITNKSDLDSLITPNFHIVDDIQMSG